MLTPHATSEWVGVGGGGGGGVGRGLQLPTIQRDSELLKRLPSWTRSTSLHTHTHTHSPFDCLSKHTSAIQTHLRAQTIMSGLGWGMGGVGWGGLQLPTIQIQSDSEVLKRLPSWTRSTSLHTHARTHLLIAFQSILLPYKLTCARKL